MSRTKHNTPKLGNIPSSFKRHQNRSQKMKLKENCKAIIENPNNESALRIRKNHAWNYF